MSALSRRGDSPTWSHVFHNSGDRNCPTSRQTVPPHCWNTQLYRHSFNTHGSGRVSAAGLQPQQKLASVFSSRLYHVKASRQLLYILMSNDYWFTDAEIYFLGFWNWANRLALPRHGKRVEGLIQMYWSLVPSPTSKWDCQKLHPIIFFLMDLHKSIKWLGFEGSVLTSSVVASTVSL